MPTPFQHLVYANRVYAHPELPRLIRDKLTVARGAYLLGSTAADVQVVTGQPRVETHFYRLEDIGHRSAIANLLTTFPILADPAQLSASWAAFISGYLVHLAWDEIWARDIFLPYYRNASHWPDRLSYFVHHNALRVLLDRKSYDQLQDHHEFLERLRGTLPDHWLPFAEDWALVQWRDWLVEQLADPARVQTTEVFARRMRIPIEDLEAIVLDMRAGTYVAVAGLTLALHRYEAAALAESLRVLLRYWRIEDRLGLPQPMEMQSVHKAE